MCCESEFRPSNEGNRREESSFCPLEENSKQKIQGPEKLKRNIEIDLEAMCNLAATCTEAFHWPVATVADYTRRVRQGGMQRSSSTLAFKKIAFIISIF